MWYIVYWVKKRYYVIDFLLFKLLKNKDVLFVWFKSFKEKLFIWYNIINIRYKLYYIIFLM